MLNSRPTSASFSCVIQQRRHVLAPDKALFSRVYDQSQRANVSAYLYSETQWRFNVVKWQLLYRHLGLGVLVGLEV